MEHRLSERHSVGLEVVLKRAGKPNVTTQARNITYDGMFICAEDGVVRRGETLDVEFFWEEKSGPKYYCQKAWVVHCCAEGAGLMFIYTCGTSKEAKKQTG